MGDFANGYMNKIISIVLSIVVIGINIYFVVSTVIAANLSTFLISLIGKSFVCLITLNLLMK